MTARGALNLTLNDGSGVRRTAFMRKVIRRGGRDAVAFDGETYYVTWAYENTPSLRAGREIGVVPVVFSDPTRARVLLYSDPADPDCYVGDAVCTRVVPQEDDDDEEAVAAADPFRGAVPRRDGARPELGGRAHRPGSGAGPDDDAARGGGGLPGVRGVERDVRAADADDDDDARPLFGEAGLVALRYEQQHDWTEARRFGAASPISTAGPARDYHGNGFWWPLALAEIEDDDIAKLIYRLHGKLMEAYQRRWLEEGYAARAKPEQVADHELQRDLTEYQIVVLTALIESAYVG